MTVITGNSKGISPSGQPLSDLHFKTKEVYCERERDWPPPNTKQILESRKDPVIMLIVN